MYVSWLFDGLLEEREWEMKTEFKKAVKYLELQFNKYDEDDNGLSRKERLEYLEDIEFASRDVLEKAKELIDWGEI